MMVVVVVVVVNGGGKGTAEAEAEAGSALGCRGSPRGLFLLCLRSGFYLACSKLCSAGLEAFL